MCAGNKKHYLAISTYGMFRKIPFCYRCTFVKWCDRLRSVPFRFFCLLRLNGTVSPPGFLVKCNTYVRTSYVHHHGSDKTYAICWITRAARASNRAIYRENCSRRVSRQPNEELPSSLRNLLSQRRSQGNLVVEDSRSETDRATERNEPWNGLWNGTKRAVERNGPFYAVFREILSPCNANETDHF